MGTVFKRGIQFNYDTEHNHVPLFIAISGADAYGWAREDSDLDIRMVWIPFLQQALSLNFKGRNIHTKQGQVDLMSYPLQNFLKLLIKGSPNQLENLFQEHAFERKNLVEELQTLTLENLHVKFLEHYCGYGQGLLSDMKNKTRCKQYGVTRLLLCAYRVLQAGLILHREKEVVFNLVEQRKHGFDSEICKVLLNSYKVGKENTDLVPDAYDEINMLLNKMSDALANAKFPDWNPFFPSTVFDRWLYRYYT